MRHALNTLASVAPDWLHPRIDPDWLERYGPRVDEYRFPKGTEQRQARRRPQGGRAQIGADGVRLYRAATADSAPVWLREVPAVETLRAVWLQQFYAPDEQGVVRWRSGEDAPPSAQLINSPYDVEMLVTSKEAHDVEVIGPAPQDTRWQARAGEGFDVACFTLDWEQEMATCPQGAQSTKWSETHDDHANPIINIRFPTAACRECSVRAQCTTSQTGPREITVRPKAQYLALQQARRYQKTKEFKARYDARAGIEATISQGLRVTDLRHARSIGLAKT